MTFVCEEMSEDDYKKYDIAFYGSRFGGGGNRIWVRDAEADVYFRYATREIGGESRNATYLFFWEGSLYQVVLFESYKDDEKGKRVESGLRGCTRVEKNGEKLSFLPETNPGELMLNYLKEARNTYQNWMAGQIGKPAVALVFDF
ncbi:hypothetical protein ACVC7V_00695 [Hydrogenophaga sp. A37]|uniref:hypothetical protein n=1 Tax=Hydrogenophaga sp. A37 TaxID=1945864 RepID=UPI0009862ACD|nr:hypothetical protein [Hydrogenophaga sp. A37]OOG88223.1 hypothetical protein B0E41_02850 [Hydrogenophaga sp. A37]